MAKLTWDQAGERLFETGVEHAVLYPGRGRGVAWNGIVSISESPSGAEPTPIYADNIKYLNMLSAEEFGATIEAYAYPAEFNQSLGKTEISKGVIIGQQTRHTFGLSYQTKIGNDKDGADHGYKIHLVYNCMAAPSEKNNNTVNDTPEAETFSWEISTTPVMVENHRPTATVVLNSVKFFEGGLVNVLRSIEDALYGTETTHPKILYASEIQYLFLVGMYLFDSSGDELTDSSGNKIRTQVFS